jgi:phage shock protein C
VAEPKRFHRSSSDRVVAGVCGGLARYFGIDATLVRILWVVATVASVGLGLLAYVLLWAFTKSE